MQLLTSQTGLAVISPARIYVPAMPSKCRKEAQNDNNTLEIHAFCSPFIKRTEYFREARRQVNTERESFYSTQGFPNVKRTAF